jgi:integrase
MARTKGGFTEDRVKALTCSAGKKYVLHRDPDTPGLSVRVTAKGARSYVFEKRVHGRSARVTIGKVGVRTLDEAQKKARKLWVLVEDNRDPRIEAAAEDAKAAERHTETQRKGMVFAGVWHAYIEANKAAWGGRHLANHQALAHPGGMRKKKRGGKGLTMPGPLAAFLPLKLSELTSERIGAWLTLETRTRPTSAAQAFRALKAFTNWTQESADYKGIIPADACTAKSVREKVPAPATVEDDCLQKEQLAAWFREVRRLSNPVISAYLQGLLLLGPRRGELTALKWSDVEFEWGGSVTLRDKAKRKGLTAKAKLQGKGTRTIPLPPYMASLLKNLPHKARNDWVFWSDTAEGGRIVEPRIAHNKSLKAAGIPHVSIHGLRRSFGTLAEWVEIPVGIVAQIQGHKPSALAEKSYRRRPLDLLRMWHDKLEAWILKEAAVPFTRPGEKAKLGVVGDDGSVQPAA